LASGELRRVEILTTPISWGAGKALYSVVRDITEQERIEREQRRLLDALAVRERQLSESQRLAKIGSWEWHIHTHIVDASRELLKLFDLPLDQPATFDQIVSKMHPEDQEHVRTTTLRALALAEPLHVVYRVPQPHGQPPLVFASQGYLVKDERGEPVRMIGTTQDVTESKHAEQELRDYTRQLEVSMRELEAFTYVASHDLQEPLRKIATFGERLKQQLQGKLDEPQQRSLDRIMSSAERMSRLIEDLLSYSRVSTRGRAMQRVSLQDVLDDAIETLDLCIEETGAKICPIGPLPAIEGDASQLEQLFQNLLSNAIKFRKPDAAPQVLISCREVARSDEPEPHIEITVKDDGIGFEERYAEQIFAAFHRLHGRDEYPGTGIGLAICRKIVERHHGEVYASSRPGEGAKFVIKLPIKQPRSGAGKER
jgi:signal transduction histidine kinase